MLLRERGAQLVGGEEALLHSISPCRLRPSSGLLRRFDLQRVYAIGGEKHVRQGAEPLEAGSPAHVARAENARDLRRCRASPGPRVRSPATGDRRHHSATVVSPRSPLRERGRSSKVSRDDHPIGLRDSPGNYPAFGIDGSASYSTTPAQWIGSGCGRSAPGSVVPTSARETAPGPLRAALPAPRRGSASLSAEARLPQPRVARLVNRCTLSEVSHLRAPAPRSSRASRRGLVSSPAPRGVASSRSSAKPSGATRWSGVPVTAHSLATFACVGRDLWPDSTRLSRGSGGWRNTGDLLLGMSGSMSGLPSSRIRTRTGTGTVRSPPRRFAQGAPGSGAVRDATSAAARRPPSGWP